MTTLTIEIPEDLVQEANARNISSQRLEHAVIRLVKEYIREYGAAVKAGEAPWTNSEEFARRVISNNRELFDELSRGP
jgi:hypothetical protein